MKLIKNENVIENLGKMKVVWLSFLNLDISKKEVILTDKRIILNNVVFGFKIITNSIWFDENKYSYLDSVKIGRSTNFITKGVFVEIISNIKGYLVKYRLYTNNPDELKNKILSVINNKQ